MIKVQHYLAVTSHQMSVQTYRAAALLNCCSIEFTNSHASVQLSVLPSQNPCRFQTFSFRLDSALLYVCKSQSESVSALQDFWGRLKTLRRKQDSSFIKTIPNFKTESILITCTYLPRESWHKCRLPGLAIIFWCSVGAVLFLVQVILWLPSHGQRPPDNLTTFEHNRLLSKMRRTLTNLLTNRGNKVVQIKRPSCPAPISA